MTGLIVVLISEVAFNGYRDYVLQDQLSGPNITCHATSAGGCAGWDLDGDRDVDLRDVANWETWCSREMISGHHDSQCVGSVILHKQ